MSSSTAFSDYNQPTQPAEHVEPSEPVVRAQLVGRTHELGRAERARQTELLVAELTACDDPARDQLLRDQLVELNMPVAATIAQRYRSRGIDYDDLRQVAYLALARAVQRFDAQSGHALLSFCVPTIRGEIRRYFRDQGWMVRPPRRLQELQQQVARAQSELTFELGRPATVEELAERLDEDPADIREAQGGQGCFTPASLDRPLGAEEGAATLGDMVEGDADDGTSAAEARITLAPVVRQLSERDRRIIQLRFYDGLTQREIAEDIGVTQMQVSRLLTRIFRDIRRGVGDLAPVDD
jgi:RNA polymerase sigma-B factor